ncbi:hypothetical protein [Aquimarina hainanensis]|uniref:hypothetical protein n=1 Tax=Aquimarina hainanensis TaxID=1578017 RepID=UPI00360BD1DC
MNFLNIDETKLGKHLYEKPLLTRINASLKPINTDLQGRILGIFIKVTYYFIVQ